MTSLSRQFVTKASITLFESSFLSHSESFTHEPGDRMTGGRGALVTNLRCTMLTKAIYIYPRVWLAFLDKKVGRRGYQVLDLHSDFTQLVSVFFFFFYHYYFIYIYHHFLGKISLKHPTETKRLLRFSYLPA